MSKRSLVSLQKEIIRDGHASIQERVKILRAMAKPSERFLRTILASDVPDELRRVASRLLVKLLSAPKVKASSLPPPEPSQEKAESTIPETNPQVQTIDPEIWDLVGGFGGNPAFKRGETASPKTEEPAARKTVRSGIPRPRNFS